MQPLDWSTYPYDAVRLVRAALTTSGGRTGRALMAAREKTVVTGANGDERRYGPSDREGVSPDDLYSGRFGRELRFRPVHDDLLSTNLLSVQQWGGKHVWPLREQPAGR